MVQRIAITRSQWGAGSVLIPTLLLLALFGIGCAASTSNSSASYTPNQLQALPSSNDGTIPTGPVELRIGDNPYSSENEIVAFQLDIGSIVAWDTTSNNWVQLMGAGSVELTHSASTSILVNNGDAPRLTYNQLVISYTGARVSALDSSGAPYLIDYTSVPQQVIDLTQSPFVPLTVGTEPSVITINIDAASTAGVLPGLISWANSINNAQPLSGGTLSTPTLLVSQSSLNSMNQQIQHEVGRVPANGVVGSALSLTLGQEQSTLTFQTGPQTDFENVDLTTAPNKLVEVNGTVQSDGSLFADEVELIDPVSGSELEGLISGYTTSGNMYIVAQDGIGAGVTSAQIGQKITVDMSGSSFVASTGKIDMTGVTALFDDVHIFPGQQVEIESCCSLYTDPDGNASQIYPFMVELEQQTISGSVTNYTAGAGNVAQFDLTLPNNSYLKLLNPGAISVHVYQQGNTYRRGLSAAPTALSGKVQVRGLLFCNDYNIGGMQGTDFIMVAAQINRQDN